MDEILIVEHYPNMRYLGLILAGGKEYQITGQYLPQLHRPAEFSLLCRIARQFDPQSIEIHAHHHPAAIGATVLGRFSIFIWSADPALCLFDELSTLLAESGKFHIDRCAPLGSAGEAHTAMTAASSKQEKHHRHCGYDMQSLYTSIHSVMSIRSALLRNTL